MYDVALSLLSDPEDDVQYPVETTATFMSTSGHSKSLDISATGQTSVNELINIKYVCYRSTF